MCRTNPSSQPQKVDVKLRPYYHTVAKRLAFRPCHAGRHPRRGCPHGPLGSTRCSGSSKTMAVGGESPAAWMPSPEASSGRSMASSAPRWSLRRSLRATPRDWLPCKSMSRDWLKTPSRNTSICYSVCEGRAIPVREFGRFVSMKP